MKYNICNFLIERKGMEVNSNPLYDCFRSEMNQAADCTIECTQVEQIELPKEPNLYHSIHGMNILGSGEIEYRYFDSATELWKDNGINKELQYLALPDGEIRSEMYVLNCLGLEKILSEHGRFVLHASFIRTEKGAILFTAPSGTGKSTQADLWQKAGKCTIVNGDRAGIWKENGLWMAGGVPWCGTSGIMKADVCPLRAIVVLRQGPENEILPFPAFQAIARILEQLTINPWNQEMQKDAQEFAINLCDEVPILLFSCRPDEEAVTVLDAALCDRGV